MAKGIRTTSQNNCKHPSTSQKKPTPARTTPHLSTPHLFVMYRLMFVSVNVAGCLCVRVHGNVYVFTYPYIDGDYDDGGNDDNEPQHHKECACLCFGHHVHIGMLVCVSACVCSCHTDVCCVVLSFFVRFALCLDCLQFFSSFSRIHSAVETHKKELLKWTLCFCSTMAIAPNVTCFSHIQLSIVSLAVCVCVCNSFRLKHIHTHQHSHTHSL